MAPAPNNKKQHVADGADVYRITKNDGYLLVRFMDDFGYTVIRSAIRYETMLPEYASTNDIWLIGKHHALITLGDLENMVEDLRRLCPRNAKRKKTAIVVEPGVTEAIALLWVKGAENRIPFTCRVFHTLERAEKWVRSSVSKVA